MCTDRVATTSVRHLQLPINTTANCRKLMCRWLWRRPKQQPCGRFAGCHQSPERNEELASECNDHGLARATAGIRGSSSIPLCQWAVLLMQQMTPGKFNHRAAHTRVASFGEP